MADRYILAVESSCDETSVAVLKNEKELLSNIIASQVGKAINVLVVLSLRWLVVTMWKW